MYYKYIEISLFLMEHLVITDEQVCSFYKEHPFLNVNSINRICVELLNTAINKNDALSTSNFHQKLLNEVVKNKDAIFSLQTTVNSIKNENMTSMLSELNDIKDEYLDELNEIVISKTTDKISSIIESNNTNLLNKTVEIIRTIIPNINSKQFEEINRSLHSFQKAIASDSQNLLKSVDTQSLKEYMNNFEIKSSLMLQNIQQPILSFITATEERIINNVSSVKENMINREESHKKIINNITSLLDKRHDTYKTENNANNHFVSFLTKSFGNGEITSKLLGMNNLTTVMKRIGKPTILVQNYEIDVNISADDIDSFMNIVSDENTCGILVSQYSGISNKNDFEIEFHNNNVIIFVHNMEYFNHKIEVAVNIIDHLYFKLHQFNKTGVNDDFTVPKDILETINNEYQMFITQKTAVIDVLKESQKKVIAQIDEIKFPSLDKYLSTKYSAPIIKSGLKCELCKCYSANNLKALAAHKRGCMRKHGLSVKINSNIPNRNICMTPITVKDT